MLRIHFPAKRWHWISLTGPDAQDFLHRLTTANVKRLPIGKGAPACFLTAQGKIRAYFKLWRYGDSDFAFEFEGGEADRWKTSLLSTIEQFTFAERMTLTDVSAMSSCWIFGEPGADNEISSVIAEQQNLEWAPYSTLALDSKVRLCHQGDRDYSRPWVSVWGLTSQLEEWVKKTLPQAHSVDLDTIEKWRILSVKPRVDFEIDDNTLPLEIGLPEVIAPAKGCYPGQEVIERIAAIGSPAQRLVQFRGSWDSSLNGSTLPAKGTLIHNLSTPPIEMGKLTSITCEGNEWIGLGLVRKLHAKEGMQIRIYENTPSGNFEAKIAYVSPYVLT